ncbi:carbohydrate-binding protein [Oerskovia sp. M15]
MRPSPSRPLRSSSARARTTCRTPRTSVVPTSGQPGRAARVPRGGQIGYMMSNDPMSWPKEKYAGVLFPNQSQFFGAARGNNHQSVFELDGKYYFTYHAPTLNKRINGDVTQGYRSTHIQELSFNADGTIQQVVGDYAGVDQVKDLDPYQVIEAETFAWQQGLATNKVGTGSEQFGSGAPHLVVSDVDAGDWSALSAVDFGSGAASVSARVKPLVAGGSIDVRLDERDGPVVGTIALDTAVGEWADVTAALTGVSGVHDVYFTFSGPQGNLAEIDTWSFEAAAENPEVAFTLSADSRCVAGKAVVTVRAVNDAEIPVDVAVSTPYGGKSFQGWRRRRARTRRSRHAPPPAGRNGRRHRDDDPERPGSSDDAGGRLHRGRLRLTISGQGHDEDPCPEICGLPVDAVRLSGVGGSA